jgi:hypothetical protein
VEPLLILESIRSAACVCARLQRENLTNLRPYVFAVLFVCVPLPALRVAMTGYGCSRRPGRGGVHEAGVMPHRPCAQMRSVSPSTGAGGALYRNKRKHLGKHTPATGVTVTTFAPTSEPIYTRSRACSRDADAAERLCDC